MDWSTAIGAIGMILAFAAVIWALGKTFK